MTNLVHSLNRIVHDRVRVLDAQWREDGGSMQWFDTYQPFEELYGCGSSTAIRDVKGEVSDPFTVVIARINPMRTPLTVVYMGQRMWLLYAEDKRTTLVVPYHEIDSMSSRLYRHWTALGVDTTNMPVNDVFRDARINAEAPPP